MELVCSSLFERAGAPKIILDKLSQKRLDLKRECWSEYFQILNKLPARPCSFSIEGKALSIGAKEDLEEHEQRGLASLVELLIPWRKGPIELFGHFIDAEWQSDLKWERLKPHLTHLEGRRVADVGCGNGYYMFKALGLKPEFVLGLDPSEKFFLAFQLIQRFAQVPNLQTEMLGIEDLENLPEFFNVVLCMGVLYHQRNPLKALSLLAGSLRKKGRLFLELWVLPGEDSSAFFPPDRYCKARNVYFLPTMPCLMAWLEKSGFSEVEVLSETYTTTEEQRRTAFAPFESLSDFLHPEDPSLTVEGYPAPKRVLLKAIRRT